MQRRRMRGHAITGEYRIETATDGIAQAAVDADVGLHAGEHQGANAALAQLLLDVGADEGAVTALLDNGLAIGGRDTVEVVAPASGAAADLGALLALLGQHALGQPVRIVVRLDPEYGNAPLARGCDE